MLKYNIDNENLLKKIEMFVSTAENQEGYVEGNNNNTPYGKWYNLNYEPWCAIFVSWCADQAGILNTIVPKYSYCPSGVSIYKSEDRFIERISSYIPKRGDVIFFQQDGISSHTGIVRFVNSSTVHTVEGNASNSVRFKNYNLNASNILGYGVSTKESAISQITTLTLGSKGRVVSTLQNILISKGYCCGSSNSDGYFGQETYNAVIEFQKENELDVDGIVGPATWNALN